MIPIHTITNEFRCKRHKICMGTSLIYKQRAHSLPETFPDGVLPRP
jgi:hypothetical protein